MPKVRHIFEKAVEPRNAVALGVAGALIFSAAFTNASFFATAADSGIIPNTAVTDNNGFTTGTITAGGTQDGYFTGTNTGTGVTNTNLAANNGSFFNTNTNATNGTTYMANTSSNYSSLRVMAIGNGIVQGVGSTNGGDFVNLLGQAGRVTITNAGASGLTTAQVLQGIDSVLATYRPQVVILMLGANDMAQGVSGQTQFNNLQQIVQRIKVTGAKVVIVGDHAGTFNPTYEAAYSQLASMTGAYYVPNALSGIVGNSSTMSDPTHLNNQGYLLLAQRIDPTFRMALQAAQNGNTGNTGTWGNYNGTTTTLTPLQVVCTATPSATSVGQSLMWRAIINGGNNGNYSYSWSGTDGLAGTSRQITGSYATPGIKSATVTVISGTQSVSATCNTTITQITQVGACFYPNGHMINPYGNNQYNSNTSGEGMFSGTYLNTSNYPVSNFQSMGTMVSGSYPFSNATQVTYVNNSKNNVHSNWKNK